MGTIVKTFLWGVAIVAGLAVGDIVSEELKDQYKGYKRKKDKKDQECPVAQPVTEA